MAKNKKLEWYQLEPNLDRITEYVIKELNLIVK